MKKLIIIALCAMVIGGITMPRVHAEASTPSEAQIIDELKTHYAKHSLATTYAKNYAEKGTKATYTLDDIGQISNDTRSNALNYLNNYRYITGLSPVGYNYELEKQTQAGAYLDYLSDTLTHYPQQTSAMSDELYETGTDGTSSSNIAVGTNLSGAVAMWMDDSDNSNISDLGHRRWLLNPQMKNVAFGSADAYTTVGVFDVDDSATRQAYAFPAREMPIEFWSTYGSAWCYNFGGDVDDQLSVTLTRTTSSRNLPSKTWTFNSSTDQKDESSGYFKINHENYGKGDVVIFSPNDITYSSGDVFHVSISGSQSVEYDVHFFDGYRADSISLNHTSMTLKKGGEDDLSVTNIPENSSSNAYFFSSSNEKVATYDEEEGMVKAKGYGEATLTCKTQYGLVATCKVTVVNPKTCPHNKDRWIVKQEPTCTKAGKAYKECSICGAYLTKKIPAHGHKWSKGYIVKKATKKHKGKKVYYCQYCDKRKYKSYALDLFKIKAKIKKNSVTLSWKKQNKAKKYRVAYRLASAKKWIYKTVKKNTITIKKLKKKQYVFKVQTLQGRKNGAWSNTKKATIK